MSNKSKKVDIKAIVAYVLCVAIAVGLVIGNYYALKYQMTAKLWIITQATMTRKRLVPSI